MTSAIILAAGESRRMGSPKPLLKYRGITFLAHILQRLQSAGIKQIVVVLGHQAELIAEAIPAGKVDVVINDQYRSGQFSSFQAGLRRLQPDTERAFMVLVDQPFISKEVILKLEEAARRRLHSPIVPTFEGKRGHPVVFPGTLFEEIMAHPATGKASDIIARHSDRVFEVEVDDPAILMNINTPEDWRNIEEQLALSHDLIEHGG